MSEEKEKKKDVQKEVIDWCSMWGTIKAVVVENVSSNENKKALIPFYHKKYFWKKMNGVLHSFFVKNTFYD